MIQKFFRWIFKEELQSIQLQMQQIKSKLSKYESYERRLENIIGNIDVSIDVHDYHKYAKSWAVISLQGSKSDYIKFINLGDSDIVEIKRFLSNFDRNNNIKIDASPYSTPLLRVN